jgi:hypothetical protein
MKQGQGEVIEKLATELERRVILMSLCECETLEDFQEYRDKLKEKLENAQ